VQELDISNLNFSNFFVFAHKPQAWKFVMWYTFRSIFNPCENTWWGACLNQCKMFFSFFSKLYIWLLSSSRTDGFIYTFRAVYCLWIDIAFTLCMVPNCFHPGYKIIWVARVQNGSIQHNVILHNTHIIITVQYKNYSIQEHTYTHAHMCTYTHICIHMHVYSMDPEG
jgi:hypothetical protein